MPEPVNLTRELRSIREHWAPRTVSTFNGHEVMVAKIEGEFVWHRHEDTDDFFLVLAGDVTIRTEHGDVALTAGELYVVPRGVRHQPVASEGAQILLIEPAGTAKTGDREQSAFG